MALGMSPFPSGDSYFTSTSSATTSVVEKLVFRNSDKEFVKALERMGYAVETHEEGYGYTILAWNSIQKDKIQSLFREWKQRAYTFDPANFQGVQTQHVVFDEVAEARRTHRCSFFIGDAELPKDFKEGLLGFYKERYPEMVAGETELCGKLNCLIERIKNYVRTNQNLSQKERPF